MEPDDWFDAFLMRVIKIIPTGRHLFWVVMVMAFLAFVLYVQFSLR